ncbi:hypothetical protein BC830DRAFT_753150 [Chytriomyces sp. MP71]|nr:hypothetical protein BC830DRAFT_753150 [Chytriomyces sp. MP71]
MCGGLPGYFSDGTMYASTVIVYTVVAPVNTINTQLILPTTSQFTKPATSSLMTTSMSTLQSSPLSNLTLPSSELSISTTSASTSSIAGPSASSQYPSSSAPSTQSINLSSNTPFSTSTASSNTGASSTSYPSPSSSSNSSSTGNQYQEHPMPARDIIIISLVVLVSLIILGILAYFIHKKLQQLKERLSPQSESFKNQEHSELQRKWWIDTKKSGHKKSFFYNKNSMFYRQSQISPLRNELKRDTDESTIEQNTHQRTWGHPPTKFDAITQHQGQSVSTAPIHRHNPEQNLTNRTAHEGKAEVSGFNVPDQFNHVQSTNAMTLEQLELYQQYYAYHAGKYVDADTSDKYASIYTIPSRLDSNQDTANPGRSIHSVYGSTAFAQILTPDSVIVSTNTLLNSNGGGRSTGTGGSAVAATRDPRRQSLVYSAQTSAALPSTSSRGGKQVSFTNTHRKLPLVIPLSAMGAYQSTDGGKYVKRDLSPLEELSEAATSVRSPSVQMSMKTGVGFETMDSFAEAERYRLPEPDFRRPTFDYILSSPTADNLIDDGASGVTGKLTSGTDDWDSVTSPDSRRASLWSMSSHSEVKTSVALFAQEQGMLKKDVEELLMEQRKKKEQLQHSHH